MVLSSLLQGAGILLVALALGGMLYFALLFVPIVARQLPADLSGDLIGGLSAAFQLVSAALTGAAALALWSRRESLVLAAVTGLFVFSRWLLLPRMERARSLALLGDPAEAIGLARLRLLSIVIGAAQAVALLAVAARRLAA